MALTETKLSKLKPTGEMYTESDSKGLSVRVYPSGVITYQMRYRFAGKQQRLDLGNYPAISLASARALLGRAKTVLDGRANPILKKDYIFRDATNEDDNTFPDYLPEYKEESPGPTVVDLVKEFVLKKIQPRDKNPKWSEDLLTNNIAEPLGHWQVNLIGTQQIVHALEKIVERGSYSTCNHVTALAKRMFAYAKEKGYRSDNPMENLTRTSIGGKEEPSGDHLTYKEIWRVWHGLETVKFSPPLQLAIKILCVTGQRRIELLEGQWPHIDFKKRLWTIPKELIKTIGKRPQKEHRVYLSPMAIDLFKKLKQLAHGSRWMFPNTVYEDKPMSEDSINQAIQRWRDKIDLPKLHPHIFRHTLYTHLEGLDVRSEIIKTIVNHSLGGMAKVYNHNRYNQQRMDAMILWADTLTKIIDYSAEELVIEEGELQFGEDDGP